jgi:hypothetical protein
MKLRIRGNSVRLRISQAELEELSKHGFTEDRACFGPDAELAYRIAVDPDGEVRAAFSGRQVLVTVPKSLFEHWLAPDQVTIRAEQPTGGTETLKILIEKDFACLAPRADEDDSDLFPNPAADTR